MRSPREIAFRLHQELRNVQLAFLPPSSRSQETAPLKSLPDPMAVAERLRDTQYAADLLQIADSVLEHKFPLLGYVLETGPNIEWRRDYLHNISTEPKYLRLVPYLDVARAGDHKNIWELNRHQHLVLLAQAFLLTGKQAYLDEIFRELESWWQQNPFQRGINWTSALEVAFRAFSWIWVFHFVGNQMTPLFRQCFLQSLGQHAYHLENNLSFYFSPNTHLLGEAVVLYAIGKLFPSFVRAGRWTRLGAETVLREMGRQVRSDGSHFEQSTYYHVYALDMFLFYAILTEPPPEYMASLARMADFLQALLGPERRLPFLGDDDGGRWFHPYGRRDEFGRATLATCAVRLGREDWTYDTEDLYPQTAWFLGRCEGSASGSYKSKVFADSGMVVLQSGPAQVWFDAGPFGPGRAGHSHADALAVLARYNECDILVDSGTYTYVGDPAERDAFRGTAAHNSIRINGQDQARSLGPFWWGNPPDVRLLSFEWWPAGDVALGECRYGGFVHQRLLRFMKPNVLLVVDRVSGPAGEHRLEQFWHLGFPGARQRIFLESEAQEQQVWHSAAFGEKHLAHCLVVERRTTLPVVMAAAVVFDGDGQLQVETQPQGAVFEGVVNGEPQRFTCTLPPPAV